MYIYNNIDVGGENIINKKNLKRYCIIQRLYIRDISAASVRCYAKTSEASLERVCLFPVRFSFSSSRFFFFFTFVLLFTCYKITQRFCVIWGFFFLLSQGYAPFTHYFLSTYTRHVDCRVIIQ